MDAYSTSRNIGTNIDQQMMVDKAAGNYVEVCHGTGTETKAAGRHVDYL